MSGCAHGSAQALQGLAQPLVVNSVEEERYLVNIDASTKYPWARMGRALLLVTSSHRLKIKTGRWQRPNLPRETRMCGICGKLNDQYHFLLECFVLKDIRQKYIPVFIGKDPPFLNVFRY